MQKERAELLGLLLDEMMEEDGLRIPDPAWYQYQRIAALPYNEVLIPRFRPQKKHRPNSYGAWEFLLTRRPADDPHWPGMWHIPGSLWRPWRWSSAAGAARTRLPVPQAEAVRITAALEDLGEIEFVEEIGTHFWTDHRYGYPISHLAVCRSLGVIEETETRRFFPLARLPEPVVHNHPEFLKRTEARLVEDYDLCLRAILL